MRYNIETIGEGPVGLGGCGDDTVLREARLAVRENFAAGLRSVLGDING